MPYIPLHACIVNHFVDLVSRHTRLSCCRCQIKHLSCQSAHFAHAILFLLREDFDVPSVRNLLSLA